MVQDLLTSDDALSSQIDDAYRLTVRRAATAGEIQTWLPQVKAGTISLDEIANHVGDRHETVKRLYQGYLVLEQAQKEGYSLEKNPDVRQKFSHLYTIIAYPNTKKFLGIVGVKYSRKNPVPSSPVDA